MNSSMSITSHFQTKAVPHKYDEMPNPPIHFRAVPPLLRRHVQGRPEQGFRSAHRPGQEGASQGCPAGGA